ncbi:MAG: glycoside hydrolase, partial [Pseudonocardia sp.]|nr:glycoside hydrolase [Pseudonocardia sp.]
MVAAVAAAIGLGLAATALPAAAGTGASAHRLPSSFRWESSGILISPKPDASHDIVSVKDPSVIRYQGQWVVYATTANTAGNQTGLPSYSTTNDPLKPSSWSAPENFLASMPPIIADNIGNGFWVDMWVICDHVNCYLFSSDDNGHLYRSQTTVKDFPNGFGNTVIAMQDPNRFALFEASNV